MLVEVRPGFAMGAIKSSVRVFRPGIGFKPFALQTCCTRTSITAFLPEAVPTVAAQMVARIAKERMVIQF